MSAVEFACFAPVFILLLLGGADMLRYVIACDRVESIANSISLMLAQNSLGTINYQDVQFYHDSAMLTYPSLLSEGNRRNVDWASTISISMAAVTFTTDPSCSSNCTYSASAVWSGGDAPRSCSIAMMSAPDNAAPSPTTLPVHVFAPGTIIVADVVYQMRPLFQSRFFDGITIRRSAYATARLTPMIKYQIVSGDNGIAQPCLGYTT
ncbi:TadE/TadG family type IV pilus assembly protein [Lichenifustis flavocetrariae]|uniref:Pilus assembly protein n=1 Tax=Lichenifustis flavocetrariae TaxID=2949735 RepID=A0AA42CK88_9HYPH|nr:hypothetical protein [Lichenifustis flavocetrariae]MCW6510338.1 hypothetical protein [Lichenifustis flavocetrariae]